MTIITLSFPYHPHMVTACPGMQQPCHHSMPAYPPNTLILLHMQTKIHPNRIADYQHRTQAVWERFTEGNTLPWER